MLEELLSQNEGKTLEFKENLKNLVNIIKCVISFANTAGGTIVIGIEDKSKSILGIENILYEEERLCNFIADSIEPLLIPDIEVVTYAGKELLVINIPYLTGPYYHKQSGLTKGTYIRLGSTNRLADSETIATLQRLAKQTSFDALPCIGANERTLDNHLIVTTLGKTHKHLSKKHYESLGLITTHHNKKIATNGGVLLFAKDRTTWLPDSFIQCVCFSGSSGRDIIDRKDVRINLIDSVSEVIAFIQRHTKVGAKIGPIKRIDIPQFPPEAIRESVINAIVHADYSMQGTSIKISIYADRIEILNPGALPYGQTLKAAMSGASKMRNPILGRVFRELKLIERLGTGLNAIINTYKNTAALPPTFEEIDHFFKVTLHEIPFHTATQLRSWETQLLAVLSNNELSTSEIAIIWNVSDRTARKRLKNMLEKRLLIRHAKSHNDPHATYTKIEL